MAAHVRTGKAVCSTDVSSVLMHAAMREPTATRTW
jgi:hypothetical protein